MDEQYPFGEAFGPATNRDQVLESAFKIYQNIVSSSETSMLSLDILYLLAESEDGVTVDRSKKRAMRKLFRPDAKHEVSMMSFIKACDSLYRRMRFFRASVGNASVIDHALETILDGFFNFLLGLVLLSILQINPWPLLVSISTLLVSISFAVGPSAAKYIEGILLIAVRRYVRKLSNVDEPSARQCLIFFSFVFPVHTTLAIVSTCTILRC
jgi:small-conductance mechanosensitive channel